MAAPTWGHLPLILGRNCFEGEEMRTQTSLTWQAEGRLLLAGQGPSCSHLQRRSPSTSAQWRAALGHNWASWLMEEHQPPHWFRSSCGKMRGHQPEFKMKEIVAYGDHGLRNDNRWSEFQLLTWFLTTKSRLKVSIWFKPSQCNFSPY